METKPTTLKSQTIKSYLLNTKCTILQNYNFKYVKKIRFRKVRLSQKSVSLPLPQLVPLPYLYHSRFSNNQNYLNRRTFAWSKTSFNSLFKFKPCIFKISRTNIFFVWFNFIRSPHSSWIHFIAAQAPSCPKFIVKNSKSSRRFAVISRALTLKFGWLIRSSHKFNNNY